MRVRIGNLRLLANTQHLNVRKTRAYSSFSKANDPRALFAPPAFPSKFTIRVPPGTSKHHILNELGKLDIVTSKEALDQNGAILLVSKEFTNWLEDESFLQSFVEILAKQNRPQSIDLLSGVVDGISSLSGRPSSPGLTILCGENERLLPQLWEQNFTASEASITHSPPCITFSGNTPDLNTEHVEVSLPLADTTFQNGNPSTLVASSWKISPNGSSSLCKKAAKITQRIDVRNIEGDCSSNTTIPLLALTPPRKIIASLGNIIRQVEIDGVATPASRELEIIIPRLLQKREKKNPGVTAESMPVWCWVIPPEIMAALKSKFEDLQIFSAVSFDREKMILELSRSLFSTLLASGCRLHRITSGGGGWGLKKSLLSIDPETSFTKADPEDEFEMFVKSFEDRDSASPRNGLATPGSFLLFCTESKHRMTFKSRRRTSSVGVALKADPSEEDLNWRFYPNHFGVVSERGMAIKSISTPKWVLGKGWFEGGIATKVDVPGARWSICR
ncbi:hypothetical protein F5Y16DRAFT_159971 [Xylariaceae sp. FL0255]|nr:hypothetical protein F5Y16DRAFT_159971 [Xylariaceae sp. FL0255]